MRLIPAGHQVIAGLADDLPVEDLAPKGAGAVEPSTQGRVRPVADLEHTLQVDGGRVGAQPFQLHGPALAVEGDHRVPQFQEDLAHPALVEARAEPVEARMLRAMNSTSSSVPAVRPSLTLGR